MRDMLCGDRYPSEVRLAVAERLVDSIGGAILLLRLIDESRLPEGLRATVVAKAAAHPDASVRVLYEKFIPEAERPKKLGTNDFAGRDPGPRRRSESRPHDLQ